jgi:hypothetical protein
MKPEPSQSCASPKERDQSALCKTLDSPSTFAEFVGVTPQSVRNWCKNGIIPLKVKVGRIIRFDRAEAMNALKGEGSTV